jgi:starch synthase
MGGVNLLKGGIAHADVVNTVSKKYAQEIQTPAFGWGMDGFINYHRSKLYGIVNGIDYTEWNPKVDKLIPKKYDKDNLAGKLACKKALQKHFGLKIDKEVPIIGMVGRFAEQKGINMVAAKISELMAMDIQLVILGSGESWAEHFFPAVASHHPDKMACYVGYSNELAHLIEAGSDLFLMPSLFEPCGLNQLYSLRYGTLPIVRATGGLEDTIDNYDIHTKNGTGFKFYDASPEALMGTVRWAVDTWHHDKQALEKMIQSAMSKHFGWEDSANAYLDLYHLAQTKRDCAKHQ